MEKHHKKYFIIMVLCFILGGFSLVSSLEQIYSILWTEDLFVASRTFGLMPIRPNRPMDENISARRNNFTHFELPQVESLILSPYFLIQLFIGITSILAGFSILLLIREKEIRFTKKATLELFLLPEEKEVLNEIENHGGSLSQREITKNTGLSRLKVHRIIKNLEQKKLVQKYKYGMTNKIVLKR